jgi:hypothetical protein
MAYQETAVCCDPNGAFHVVRADPTQRFIRCAHDGATLVTAWKRQADGHCCVSNGVRTLDLGATNGNQCVTVTLMPGAFRVAWVRDTATWVWQVFPADLLAPGAPVACPIPPEIRGTSQGFLQWDRTADAPVWTDLRRVITIGGYRMSLPMTVGPSTVGQTQDQPGAMLWDGAKMWRIWSGESQLPPQLAATSTGDWRVALSAEGGPVVGPADAHPFAFVPQTVAPITRPFALIGA